MPLCLFGMSVMNAFGQRPFCSKPWQNSVLKPWHTYLNCSPTLLPLPANVEILAAFVWQARVKTNKKELVNCQPHAVAAKLKKALEDVTACALSAHQPGCARGSVGTEEDHSRPRH